MEGEQRILNVNVGILGHVDSGKTSLVKALSTSLSTAALDKNPQSQQRGITLDLGFSAFTLPLPEHVKDAAPEYDLLQFTLVDCPGHASLIRTIIGGAQIIDMMVLVIDINKGIQTQTAECIVVGEITTDTLIIVLNKVDMIPEEERETKIEKMKNKMRKVFSTTKFPNAPIILTSAAVGGEKVAAVRGKSKISLETYGVDALISTIQSTITVPKRSYSAPFYYSIDHCFPIKGHGTVLTGTVLAGTVSINSTIELPELQVQKKVKSMQMFKKPVREARQGDRVGICVTNLDAKLVERGIAVAPGSVPHLSAVICLVRKVRFYHNACKTSHKFHISIGHTTVVATALLFGAAEFSAGEMNSVGTPSVDSSSHRQASLNASYHALFPNMEFPWDQDFVYQEELIGGNTLTYGAEPLQWMVLQFQQPVYCPIGSLVIGSRLETNANESHSTSNSCRLAFFGPVVTSLNGTSLNIMEKIKIYHWKEKTCSVLRPVEVKKKGDRELCYEAIAWKLYAKEASVRPYIGMNVETADGHAGTIVGAFGSADKFRVKFPGGASNIEAGAELRLRFKRYMFDTSKKMSQAAMKFMQSVEEESAISEANDLETEDMVSKSAESVKVSPLSVLPRPKEKNGRASDAIPPSPTKDSVASAVQATSVELSPPPSFLKVATAEPPAPPASPGAAMIERKGAVESVKTTDDCDVVIVTGAFTMQENVRSYIGSTAQCSGCGEGTLIGPFAKMGKCKVSFAKGHAPQVGDVITLKLVQS